MDRFIGGCLCGNVRIVASRPPYRVGLCHCLDCRKHHGALFHASAVFPQDAVTIDGETRDYAGHFSVPIAARPFSHVAQTKVSNQAALFPPPWTGAKMTAYGVGGGGDVERVVGYGALLAAGALALQWLDYQRLARMHSGNVYLFLVAAAFLVLGIVLGVRVFAAPAPVAFDGNPKAQAALGLSERELEVLHELAAGRSNKEIAVHLHVSPNTVKTHVARLFGKLGARRRTEAIHRARELGIVP